MEVQIHVVSLDASECSASLYCLCLSRERPHLLTHWLGCSLGPKAGLNVVRKRETDAVGYQIPTHRIPTCNWLSCHGSLLVE